MEYKELYNGVQMPMLGYGVFQIDNAQTERCVKDAIDTGYRLIDTAQAYHNEEGVGAALAKAGVPRDQLFVTSKVWVTNYGEGDTMRSIDESLKRLGTDYLDLMLLHQAYGDYYGAYRDLEKAYDQGKVRAIGVSNFDTNRILDISTFARIKPMVNQVETHVYWQQRQNHQVMDQLGIAHEAWGPFAEGANGFFSDPMLSAIGLMHGKGVGQVALRYLMDLGVIVIPKSTHKERMAQNIDVFDFKLSKEDRSLIASMDANKSIIFDHRDPKVVAGFMKWFENVPKQA
ncbi:aldo/keto reductase [Parafannyhessea umbonata]|uniref:Aldo/keto reductase n=1 Tax=Parafannyhessea umbonata TaxID=604330 RepID=A0A1G6MLX4_9ACTN|nr:aldo/keto reductase [Parafannyhessea umbonata]SDC56543.1 Aldo/keto reductase [Parafannyhessea umbonata]